MAINYTSKSPYYKTSLSKGYLDVAVFRNITARSDDPLYVVDAKYENRPDLLAYDLYKDSNLWWVFAARNKDTIKDPVYDLVPGVQIYLPRLSNIQTELGI